MKITQLQVKVPFKLKNSFSLFLYKIDDDASNSYYSTSQLLEKFIEKFANRGNFLVRLKLEER